MITIGMLERKVALLNTLTGQKDEPFTLRGKKLTWNIGHYCIERSNGYYNLSRIVGKQGGQEHLTRGTKSDIVYFIDAYIKGIEARS